MNVLLIRPDAHIQAVPPPLGLLYLASSLQRDGDHQVKIIDGRLFELDPQAILDRADGFDPDIIGITSLTVEGPYAHEMAAACKKRWPSRPVVMGGPYATSDVEKAMSDPLVDFCFQGEAEVSFSTWIKSQMGDVDLMAVHGLAYRSDGQVCTTPNGYYVENLDSIPFPAWDLIDVEDYFKKHFMRIRTMNPHQLRNRAIPMMSSRGCPYRCSYCHNIFGKKLRHRSVENILAELKMLKSKYNVEEVEFLDDIFNLDIPWAKQVFRAVIDHKLNMKFSFPNGLRSDCFDDELLDLMKEGGVYRMCFAIESGSKRIQKLVHKNLNLEKARVNISKAEQRGFFIGGFFIIGFPDETEAEVWKTIQFACKSKLHTAVFFIMQPFPKTEVWDMAVQAGMPVEVDFTGYYQVSINLSRIPTTRLERLRSLALLKFYLNPVRLFHFACRAPKFWKRSVEMASILFLSVFNKWRG
ncbi:MAG: radical SAM protein [bacterium]